MVWLGPTPIDTEVKKNIPGYRPKRWIVELAHSWFNRF
jgi:hypothetical protein